MTRRSRAISPVLAPRENRRAASSRNRSRRCCSAGVYPPRCSHLMPPVIRQQPASVTTPISTNSSWLKHSSRPIGGSAGCRSPPILVAAGWQDVGRRGLLAGDERAELTGSPFLPIGMAADLLFLHSRRGKTAFCPRGVRNRGDCLVSATHLLDHVP